MATVDHPKPFTLARLPPFQRAGSSHQALEYLGEMAGMEHDQPHALKDALCHTLDDFVADAAMVLMSPPDQHIGSGKTLFAQAMFRFLQGRSRRFDCAILVERIGDGVVHPVRID